MVVYHKCLICILLEEIVQFVDHCLESTLCSQLLSITASLALPLSVIHEMPEGMDSLVGSLAEPASCCISGLKLARFESGMNVVITGAGIIGLLTGVFAKQFGANCVIISDPKKDRRDLAKKMGINITVDPTSENLSQVVVDNIGEFGCDIGIEAVGSLSLLEELFPIVNPRGTIQLAGVNPKDKNFPFYSFDFHFKEKVIAYVINVFYSLFSIISVYVKHTIKWLKLFQVTTVSSDHHFIQSMVIFKHYMYVYACCML